MAKVTEEQIIDEIRKANVVKDVDALENDKSLSEQGVDSLDFSSLLFNIEEKFGVVIPDEDIDELQTITQITTYVNAKN
ncbi:MAG: acyl carrier protein [Piscirickettsiaceae bacterium]|nr:acyl carrier protein [Piscirickettsiaceae bacterium]